MRVTLLMLILATGMIAVGCGTQDAATAADVAIDIVAVDAVDASSDLAFEVADTQETWSPLPKVDYLIVTADGLVQTAQSFADYRESTGHTVVTITVSEVKSGQGLATDASIRAGIQEWVRAHFELRDKDRPFFLLIVGDAHWSDNPVDQCVPAGQWAGGWQGAWSDNHYADMDMDRVPDLAVGRLPIRTNPVGLDILERIVQHETTYVVGPWNRRIGVYAGEGGFGEDVDFFIETVAQEGLESVPYEYDLSFAYNSTGSVYYYAPFKDKVLDMVTEGAVLVTFMGHGGGELNVQDLDDVVPRDRFPMYAFFACSTGDFLSSVDCETEVVFKQAGGPMAILASTATTHPYANAVNALEMEAAVFEDRPETFGEAIRLMKWRSMYNTSDLREMIDTFAVLYMEAWEMPATIEDHMYSYNLLGDPATRIRFPAGAVEVQAEDTVTGATVEFSGTVDNILSGTAQVKLVAERAKLLHTLDPVENPQDQSQWPQVQENWEKAVDKTACECDVEVSDGAFGGTLEVPPKTPPGNYFVTVYADDGVVDAVGSVQIKVKKAP